MEDTVLSPWPWSLTELAVVVAVTVALAAALVGGALSGRSKWK